MRFRPQFLTKSFYIIVKIGPIYNPGIFTDVYRIIISYKSPWDYLNEISCDQFWGIRVLSDVDQNSFKAFHYVNGITRFNNKLF